MSVCLFFCLSVCPSHFLTPFNGLFAPISWSPMSKSLRFLESFGKLVFQERIYQKKSLFVFFMTISDQFCAYKLSLRPLLSITFPQGFQKSKKFGHWTSGNGGKKTFKRYLKKWTDRHTDKQTDKQTDKHMDISTYRKHRPRGPMLWKNLKSEKT